MSMHKKYIVALLMVSMFWLPLIVDSTWKDESCVITGASCKDLSHDFTQPYCISDGDGVDHVLNCQWLSLTNTLSAQKKESLKIEAADFEMRNVIEQYCKALLWNGNSGRIYYAKKSNVNDGDWDWQQTFDSRQSMFVYALCSSFKEWGDMAFVESPYLSDVFKEKDLVAALKLKQRSGGKDLCSLDDEELIDDCDMSIYATEIFSTIMSDVFKIKYAQVLNIDDSENFKPDDKVVQFMSWYFNYYDKTFDQLNDKFPDTIDVLKSNQKFYKKVLDSVKIINNSEMALMASNSKCPIVWNKKMEWVDFIACALHSSQWKWSSLTPSFVTLVYNEMLNYHMFQLYMNAWIEKKSEKMQNIAGRQQKDVQRYLSKALDFQWYANIQIDATKQALRRFEDFNMSYPLHIWLLLYQENIHKFRDKNLSPIVTLFYSLSEKLQNVQLPE